MQIRTGASGLPGPPSPRSGRRPCITRMNYILVYYYIIVITYINTYVCVYIYIYIY